jgi:uncharacterized protein (TIGR01732 family)
MKYVILLISAIALMIASCQSGMLNVNAISAKDIREHLQGIDKDQVLNAFESLKSDRANNQWLQGIDKDQVLNAFESLKSGESDSYAGGFVLILVLFILLVIIGAGFGIGDGTGGDEDQISSEDVQSGGNIPLMTMEP